jgi:hypothetical protein
MWGWPNHLIGGGQPPLYIYIYYFNRGGSAGLGVAEPLPWPMGWFGHLFFFFFFLNIFKRGHGVAWPIWGWPNHPYGLKGGQPPSMGWFGHPCIYI